MRIAETIKTAREGLGLTQEDLAERLDVSRQAVSKWELGTSVPSPENLRALSELLGVPLSPEGQAEVSKEAASPPRKQIALALGGLLAAVCAVLLFTAAAGREAPDVPDAPGRQEEPEDPFIKEIHFYDESGAPLHPDPGDGWCMFTAGQRVILAVEFQNGTENSVNGAALFLTPTGTETYGLREQLAVQAVADGCSFALFVLEIPKDLMGHLDITLECGGGLTVTETLNVTAAISSESETSQASSDFREDAPEEG